MSDVKPWRCRRCQTELGVIEVGELRVSTHALAVRCTRDGTTWIGCPTCGARRAWKARPEKTQAA